jgi:hypothetical protein
MCINRFAVDCDICVRKVLVQIPTLQFFRHNFSFNYFLISFFVSMKKRLVFGVIDVIFNLNR